MLKYSSIFDKQLKEVAKLIFPLPCTITFCESVKGLSKQKHEPEEQEANKQQKSTSKKTPGADIETQCYEQQRYTSVSGKVQAGKPTFRKW